MSPDPDTIPWPFVVPCAAPGCRADGCYGEGVRLLQGRTGTWWCPAHVPGRLVPWRAGKAPQAEPASPVQRPAGARPAAQGSLL